MTPVDDAVARVREQMTRSGPYRDAIQNNADLALILDTLRAQTEALGDAVGWFEDYGRQHEAKHTDDGDRKARVNATRAERLRAALNPSPRDATT